MHSKRKYTGGVGKVKVDPEKRWQAKFHKEGRCLVWNGTLNKAGRGTFYDGYAQIDAQTYAWKRAHHAYPDFPVVPQCGTRGCVNVAHLGPRRDKRSRTQEAFTENDVRAIRRRFDQGEPVASIAKDYPASESAVGNAARGRTYTWVKEDIDD